MKDQAAREATIPHMARPTIYPISERCMKLDYSGKLDAAGCLSVKRAVIASSQEYPERDLIVVIQDSSHRILNEAKMLIDELLPTAMPCRVAVVWMSRLIDCDSMAMRPSGSSSDVRLYGAAQYRDALAWLEAIYE